MNVSAEDQHRRRLELQAFRAGDLRKEPPARAIKLVNIGGPGEKPHVIAWDDPTEVRSLAEVWGLVPPRQPYAGK